MSNVVPWPPQSNPQCWPPQPSHPIWPPQPPQDCDCGCGGNPQHCTCGGHWWGLAKCYSDMKALNAIIQQIVNDTLAQPVALKGVTDGSSAAPGMVGETIRQTTTFNVPTTAQTIVVSPGSLPPGDWNVEAILDIEGFFAGIRAYLNPVPPGVSAAMNINFFTQSPTAVEQELLTIPSGIYSAKLSVPTLFAFTVITNNWGTPGAAAGPATLSLGARRMR